MPLDSFFISLFLAPVHVTRRKKDEVGSCKEEVLSSLPCGEHKELPSSTSTAAEEMLLLDEILSRAQKLRAVQPPEVYTCIAHLMFPSSIT